MKIRTVSRRGRTARPDSEPKANKDTRMRLLEVAGQVFARRGVASATGREICQRAGVNAAAINYHFGGIEPLYEAVLEEIIRRMISTEELAAAVTLAPQPLDKLRAIVGFFVRAITGPLSQSWEVRVLAREMISPTSARLFEKEILKKLTIIRRVIAEILHLDETHPAVAMGYVSVMAPCLILLVGRERFQRFFTTMDLSPEQTDAIADTLARSGLAALQESARRFA